MGRWTLDTSENMHAKDEVGGSRRKQCLEV